MTEQALGTAQLKQLDQLCDEFESRWQQDERPSLRQFVEDAPGSIRSKALEDLLQIEIDHRREKGEQPAVDDYLQEFSDRREIVERVFENLKAATDTHGPSDTADFSNKRLSNDKSVELPDYEMLEELGRGGMGVVYKARQISLDRIVAVKLIQAGEFAMPEQIERFVAEAKAAAKLQHPGIVAVYEVGQSQGNYYFSMEYVEGQTFEQLLEEGNVSAQSISGYVQAVAEAIDFAHQRGVLHRDIKPSNILIDQFDRVRVMDFGLAKIVDNGSDLTSSGQILGTPMYMSPEQALGELSKIDGRTDVYSLGAVLYRALAGTPPFKSTSAIATMAQVIRDQPESPRTHNPSIDRELEEICLRCLQKEPEDRFATASELADSLQQHARCDIKQVSTATDRPPTNRRVLIALGGLAALILVAAVVITIKLGDKKVIVKADGDAQVDVEGDRVTVKTDGKTVVVQQNDGNESPPSKPEFTGRSAFDKLHREDIDSYELRVAGGGDAKHAPQELVGIFGGSRLQEGRPIWFVEFSPDGETILSQGEKQLHIKQWDAKSGELLRKLSHDAVILGKTFHPDGKRLFTASRDGVVKSWELATGRELASFKLPEREYAAMRIAISPDGKAIAFNWSDGTNDMGVEFYSTDDGRLLDDVKVETSDVTSLSFQPHGDLLATGHKDGSVRLWRLLDGALTREMKHDKAKSPVWNCVFRPDGDELTSTVYGQIIVWNLDTGKERLSLPIGPHKSRYAYSPDGGLLAAPSISGFVTSDLSTGETTELRVVGGIEHVDFSPDGKSLVTSRKDGAIRIRNPEGELLLGPAPHIGAITDLAVTPDTKRMVTTSVNATAKIWDVAARKVVFTFDLGVPGKCTTIDPKGEIVAFGGGPIRLFSLANGHAIPIEFDYRFESPRTMAFSPNGKLLAWGGKRSLKMISAADGKLVQEIDYKGGNFQFVFTPDSKQILASFDHDKFIRFFDVDSGEEVRKIELDSWTTTMDLSADGRFLFARGWGAGDWTKSRLVDLKTNEVVRRFDLCSQGVFSPDGRTVATRAGNKVSLWPLDRLGKPHEVTFGHETDRIEFAPDGRHLLMQNRFGTVYVLRIAKKQ
jgi:serine/threonine protein kinase/WD40 repeat protein